MVIGAVPMSFGQMTDPVTVKPLVILMEYQDYKHTEMVTKEDAEHVTGGNYASYEKALYETLFFGEGTYTSVDGNQYDTVREYYRKVSGGYYNMDGDVFGWYTASKNAKEYGSDTNGNNSDQDEAAGLVQEAIDFVAQEPGVDLAQYDVADPHDFDKDGNTYEPDGEIDCLVVIHAGRGEEFGGGTLGEDAIWPFRAGLSWSSPFEKYEVTYGDNKKIIADDFCVFEQDFPVSLACHEYGHYLDMPDLYSGDATPPVDEWSNMGGSYTGSVPGALIPAFGAYCRDELQTIHGGDWARRSTLEYNSITDEGSNLLISAASTFDPANDDLIRINLPAKTTRLVTPSEGNNAYFSGAANDLKNEMKTTLDLTSASAAELSFKTWYDIDPLFDYVSVQIRPVGGADSDWTAIQGNITTTENPNDDTPDDATDRNPGHGITNDSANKWVDATFDLKAYAGQNVEMRLFWWTDGNTPEMGLYLDEIKVTADGATILDDNAEGANSAFSMNGFTKTDGTKTADHYYLLEWRNDKEEDEALTHITWYNEGSVSNKGLVIWYIDELYKDGDGGIDQNTVAHPGHLFAGVVDAGQNPVVYRNVGEDETKTDRFEHQMHDAAFSLRPEPLYLIPAGATETVDVDRNMQPVFDDSHEYYNHEYRQRGILLEEYGLQIFVLEENADSTDAKIHVKRTNGQVSSNMFSTDLTFNGVEVQENAMTLKVDGQGLKDNATAIYVNERFPNRIQANVDLTNNGSEFTGTIPVKTDDGIGTTYFTGIGNDLKNEMKTTLDLSNVSTAQLNFDAWYDIDPLFDYASVQIRPVGGSDSDWTAIQGNITTTENPNDETPADKTDRNPGHGITNDSAGKWVDATFDLNAYAGQNVEMRFYWWTDTNTLEAGMYMDNIQVIGDGAVILEDDAEAFGSQFELNGFMKAGNPLAAVTMNNGSSYYSGNGNDLRNEMKTTIDLKSVSKAELNFATWYDIDPEFDYASVQVRPVGGSDWTAIQGNITVTENPNDDTPDDATDRNPGHGITKDSIRKWKDAKFDLSAYAGQEIELRFFFWSDDNLEEFGIFVDDIKVIGDGQVIFEDDAEGASKFELNGFTKSEDTYKLAHVVFEKTDGSFTALYNSAVYNGYGVDMTETNVTPTNEAPTAVITAPATAKTDEAVSFDGSGSEDTDGTIVSYAWNFGDGATSEEENPQHTFTTEDTFTVSLTVTDDKGATNNATQDIAVTKAIVVTVTDQEPNNEFAQASGPITDSVIVLGHVDGSDYSDKYLIRATSTDDIQISVTNNGTSNINWTSVKATNTGSYAAWPTEVNGNVMAGTLRPSEAGDYYLTIYQISGTGSDYRLEVTMPGGGVVVEPNAAPTAAITAPAEAIKDEAVSFNSDGSEDTDGTIASYAWDFGNGATSTEADPQYAYTATGTFTVELTVTDDKGATGSTTKSITIKEPAVVVEDTEPNNNFAQASGPIAGTVSINGHIDNADYADKFLLKVDSLDAIQISLTNNGASNLTWTVVKATNTGSYEAWPTGGSGNVRSGTLNPSGTGDFYITVYQTGGSGSDYVLDVVYP